MKNCKFPKCDTKASVFGYCQNHYRRYRKFKHVFDKSNPLQPHHPYDYHCVYIIGALAFPVVKVGRSSSLVSRLQSLQVGNPYRLQIYGARFGHPDVVAALEFEVHKVLTECDCHFRSEWFEVEPADVESVFDKCAETYELMVYTPLEHHKLCMRDMGVDLSRPKRKDEDDERLALVQEIKRNAANRTC